MRLLLKIFFIIFAIIGVERLCHRATDGFAMVNIYPPPGDHTLWQCSETLDPNLISQTYRYYSCGSQSYIFLSDDGKTVLKFFKFQHIRIPPWLEYFPSNPYLDTKRAKKRRALETTFNSITLAYDIFRKETGLLFIHLTKTHHLNTRIKLIDKIGKTHQLDLDLIPFLIQKKGTLAYQAIEHWIEQGEVEKAKSGIKNLLSLALCRCKKGIFDKDPNFRTNFGFINDTPFQIDFGRFALDPLEKKPHVYRAEMIRITRDFQQWIEKNHPNLLDYFNKELHILIE